MSLIALAIFAFNVAPVHAADPDGFTLSAPRMSEQNYLMTAPPYAETDIILVALDQDPNDDVVLLWPPLLKLGPVITVADLCPPSVPEPSSISLFAITGVGFWLRRKRR